MRLGEDPGVSGLVWEMTLCRWVSATNASREHSALIFSVQTVEMRLINHSPPISSDGGDMRVL